MQFISRAPGRPELLKFAIIAIGIPGGRGKRGAAQQQERGAAQHISRQKFHSVPATPSLNTRIPPDGPLAVRRVVNQSEPLSSPAPFPPGFTVGAENSLDPS